MRSFRSVFVFLAVLFPLIPSAQAQAIRCSSEDGEKKVCEADTRHGARLVKQLGDAPCKQDSSWGFDEEGIWVDHGCKGEFALGSEAPAEGDDKLVSCSSYGGKKYCQADTRFGAKLVQQRSSTACTQGTSWGFDEQGIWVDHGCSGDFAVGGASHPDVPGSGSEGSTTTVNCISDDGRRDYCGLNAPHAKVRLLRQTGSAPCLEGSTWGYDGQDIWVDRGCRGDFLVQRAPGEAGPLAKEKSCAKSAGKQRAKELVQQCQQVSPGTHPPCSAENSCRLITEGIKRSCELLGPGAPGFCAEYK